MADPAQLAAQTLAELQQTTISYPDWVRHGRGPGHWRNALGLLGQIYTSAPAPPAPSPGLIDGPWYPTSAWPRRGIGPNPALDPRSKDLIDLIVANIPKGLAWDDDAWSMACYHCLSTDPTVTVTLSWGGTVQAPWRPGMFPTPDTDAHASFLCADTGFFQEFEGFKIGPGNVLTAATVATGNVLDGDAVSREANAIDGISPMAGMVLPATQASATHALRVGLPCLGPGVRWPAYDSDGQNPDGPDMGSCLWLPPTVDLSGLDTFATLTCQRAQRYGWWAGSSNQGTAMSAYAQATIDGSSYTLPFTGVPVGIIAQMHVLAAAS